MKVDHQKTACFYFLQISDLFSKQKFPAPQLKLLAPLLPAPLKKLPAPQKSYLPGLVNLAQNRGGRQKQNLCSGSIIHTIFVPGQMQ